MNYNAKAWTVVGYMYQADIYCPSCLIKILMASRELSPAAIDMKPEDALDQLAETYAIDRYDESSFDSGDFPKVIFDSYDHCGGCSDEL